MACDKACYFHIFAAFSYLLSLHPMYFLNIFILDQIYHIITTSLKSYLKVYLPLYIKLNVCEQKFLSAGEIIKDNKVSMRCAAIKHAVGKSQGFVYCNCMKMCTSKKCFCKKKSFLCITKFHSSLTCGNK